ncbi:hypothetical protein DOLIC_00126 [Dolichomitus sp. PSUC_FEM 10030005]|nr:hypothetical protein [Dolichomitus sp. PSUC_FEM 10030005]
MVINFIVTFVISEFFIFFHDFSMMETHKGVERAQWCAQSTSLPGAIVDANLGGSNKV